MLQITQLLGIFPKSFLSNLIDNFERLDIEFWERTLHIMKAGLKLAFRGPLLAQVFSIEIKALEVEQLLAKTRPEL